MSALLDKIKKNSTIEDTATLKASKIYGKKDIVPTPVAMMNVGLSGEVDGGLTPGITLLAGPSKHFKTLFALVMAASYMKKYPDAVLIFYDNEFGSPQHYFTALDIDMNRVVHTPILTIEQLKMDLANQLTGLERGDRVMIVVDSIGQLASNKEVQDALDEKLVADMTRAKALKSLFRIVTPHLTLKDIPMVLINHTYKEQGMFPKDIVSGGTGPYYAADTIWIIGRQQDKDTKTKTIEGWHFIINIEKSRFVKEKVSRIPITVTYDGGINRWSGLLEEALEAKIVGKPLAGRYQRLDDKGAYIGERYTEDQIETDEAFWKDVLENTHLKDFIREKYTAKDAGSLLSMDDLEEEEA